MAPQRIVALAVCCAIATGCKVYDESMLLEPAAVQDTQPEDTGVGVGWWSHTDPASQCYSAGLPGPSDRPANTAPGEIEPLVFAVRAMRLGSRNEKGEVDKDAWKSIGFDLDNTCSTSPTCPAAEQERMSCSSGASVLPDGRYCRDNMFGQLEYSITQTPDIGGRFRLNDPTFNCSLCQGAYNFLFKFTGYNGQSDDSSIRVDIYPSPGLDVLKPIDCAQYNDHEGWDTNACWGKYDAWQLQSDYVPAGPTGDSKLYDPSGYVRSDYFVASLPANTVFWFPGNRAVATSFPMVLQGGLVTGKFVRTDDEWRIEDGMIAGRIKVSGAIEGFRLIGMCEDDPLFQGAALIAQSNADVLSSGAVAPEARCDAISVGIAFTASQATMGSVVEVEPLKGCVRGADAGTGGQGGDHSQDASSEAQ